MATNTYIALDKVTVGTATPSITFSSIPQGYTDLVVVAGSVTVSNDGYALDFKINGDTGSNYSLTNLSGNGSTTRSDRVSNGTNTANDLDYYYGFSSSSPGSVILNFMNYSNSTTYKTVLARSGTDAKQTEASVHLWRSTAAITSIEIGAAGSNIAAGSTFSLYGISAQPAWAAKATGGTITSDVQYTYHTFTSSGTFTPSQALSCDYLVVAGGGGGSFGGGGGGGYLTSTNYSTASGTGYTVTVGAGGAGGTGSGATATVGADSVFGAITATGGGFGGGATNNFGTAGNGGSGGGSGHGTATGGVVVNLYGTGTSGQGYNGGAGYSDPYFTGGGGGGAGAVGGNSTTTTGGAGGAGAFSSITGTSVGRAGGGGGAYNGTATSGGGAGATAGNTNGANGTANTGGGGGGCNRSGGGGATTSGNGGSGIVIIRYAN